MVLIFSSYQETLKMLAAKVSFGVGRVARWGKTWFPVFCSRTECRCRSTLVFGFCLMSKFTLGICLKVTINMKLIFAILPSEAFALGYRECLLQHQYILCFISNFSVPPLCCLFSSYRDTELTSWSTLGRTKSEECTSWLENFSLQVLQQKDEYKISKPEQEVSGKASH